MVRLQATENVLFSPREHKTGTREGRPSLDHIVLSLPLVTYALKEYLLFENNLRNQFRGKVSAISIAARV